MYSYAVYLLLHGFCWVFSKRIDMTLTLSNQHNFNNIKHILSYYIIDFKSTARKTNCKGLSPDDRYINPTDPLMHLAA